MRAAWSFITAALTVAAQASTLTPPVLPLIVRNPYLSTWLSNARKEPWTEWPMFWTGQHLGFSVLASVPGSDLVYPLLGRPHDSLPSSGDGYNVSFPKYLGAQYDASTTNLSYTIPAPKYDSSSEHTLDPLHVTLSFLSPITPTSTFRQSIPAAYLTVYVEGGFDIDVYLDVNGEWISGDRDAGIEWEFSTTAHGETSAKNEGAEAKHELKRDAAGLKTWKVRRSQQLLFTEINDRSEWGELHLTGPSDVRHECGTSARLRQHFSRTGTLRDEVDDTFRSIMDEEPVFAFSKSFKLSKSRRNDSDETLASRAPKVKDSVLFTIAHIQDPVIQFAAARGMTNMRPLWMSWFLDAKSLLSHHYHDFSQANRLARNYSDQLAIDAYQSGSDSYVDIVALSARQTMGGTSFSGTADEPLLFLKEISSDGNCQTVDVIFPAFPFFLYTNPRWLAYLLEPLLEHQLSGQYPNKYSMHDLGASFPNNTGHSDGRDEYMPLEECGDMLIMAVALINSLSYGSGHEPHSMWSALGNPNTNAAALDVSESIAPLSILESREGIDYLDDRWGGDVEAKGAKQSQKWVGKSYPLWKQWAGYLVEFALEPHNQLSTDDFAGWLALHSNLALKGIIGIKAMSEVAAVLDKKDDFKHYQNISETYVSKWEEFAFSRDKTHAKLAYNWYGSWTTLYSLYADAILCFHPSLTNSSSLEAEAVSPAPVTNGDGQRPMLPKPGKDIPDTRKPITKDFIPEHVYHAQSRWYSLVMQRYGLPLDSRHLYTKSDWEFEAAAVSSRKTRSEILNRVSKWVNETVTDRPLTDLYETEGRGEFPGPHFFARPVVGGHFAFLALERACGGNGKAYKALGYKD